VGRASELALLERHLSGLGPPLLALAGEPGIGKTRLLHEALHRAPGYGWRVLEGGCQRQDEQEPYAPLLGALERHIRRGGMGRADPALEGCAWLVRLLPELAEWGLSPVPAGMVAPAQERRLMFGAVAAYLANVAGPAGTLLVLDDLQWAGADVFALLTALIRATAPLPTLGAGPAASQAVPLRVVAAYRDTEAQLDEPLSLMMTDLAHAGLAMRQTLVPLTAVETRQLFDRLLAASDRRGEGAARAPDAAEDRARRERVVARTGGVPFFVVSYAQDLGAAGPAGESHRWEGVPWDVAQSIRQRVAALPRPAQVVLGAAAVIGRAAPPALLRSVCGLAEQETLAALVATGAAGLLVEEGTAYRFAHDVIREVVEVDLGLAQRLALHRRIAASLEEGPGASPVELLAYHYSRSDAPDKAVPFLDQAGDAAVQRAAYATAEGYYEELVERLDELRRVQAAAGARVKLGAVRQAGARHDAALAVLERAAETYRVCADLERLAQVTAQIAVIYADKGQPDAGLERIRALLETVEARGPSPTLARLYQALGHLLYFSGRIDEARAATERLADLARTLGDAQLLAPAELARGNELRMMGRVEEALPVMEEAIRLAESLHHPAGLIGALDNMAWVFIGRGELAAAAQHNGRALALAERLGHPLLVANMTCTRGAIAFLRGAWDQAQVDLERAAATGRVIGEGRGFVYPLAALGRLCLAAGEWEMAARYLEECRIPAERSGDIHGLRSVQGALAELDLREGRPAAARARLVPLLDRPGLDEWPVTELLPLLASAHLELGEVTRAADVARHAIRRGRAQTHRLALVEALRVQSLVLLRQECWDQAERPVAEALALARRLRLPYAEARVLQVDGAVAAAKKEPDRARERLQAALAIFRRLPAHRDAEQTVRTLTELEDTA
jgi:tetratricopeptide (TPR) repeat protein